MTFNQYINKSKGLAIMPQNEVISHHIKYFMHGMVDSSKLNYTIGGYNAITGWEIDIHDDYTDYIFNTDQTTLTRQLKVEYLLTKS